MQEKSFRTFEKRARLNSRKLCLTLFEQCVGYFTSRGVMNTEQWQDGAYGLSSLSEKNRESNHLQINSKSSTFYSVIERPSVLVTGALPNLACFNVTITESSGNQWLEKCVRYVVLLHNWELRFSASPPTIDMVITSYFWNKKKKKKRKKKKEKLQLEFKSSCLASDGHQHEIEAKCVSQFKMAAKAWNDLASASNTRRTSQNPRHWKTSARSIE